MNSEYLFVYGSLRKVASTIHPYLMHDAEYVGNGYMQGRLYEIKGYPGAVETANAHERVLGEVYLILAGPVLLERLDAYEECNAAFTQPHEYVRKVVPVTLHDGSSVMAWVYVFNHDVSGLRQIRSGNYRDV